MTVVVFFSVSDAKMVNEDSVVVPRETTQEDLLVVHTQSYLESLRVSRFTINVVRLIVGLCIVFFEFSWRYTYYIYICCMVSSVGGQAKANSAS